MIFSLAIKDKYFEISCKRVLKPMNIYYIVWMSVYSVDMEEHPCLLLGCVWVGISQKKPFFHNNVLFLNIAILVSLFLNKISSKTQTLLCLDWLHTQIASLASMKSFLFQTILIGSVKWNLKNLNSHEN